jgi:cell division protein FtsI/penicillin-binding protein 2
MKPKLIRLLALTLVVTVLAGCTPAPAPTSTPEPTHTPAPTPTLPEPQVRSTAVPDAAAAAASFLNAWKAEDYTAMYALLSSKTRELIDEEAFIARYRETAAEAAQAGVSFELYHPAVDPYHAQVGFEVILQSVLVGEIHASALMDLTLENGAWRVNWDEALVLPGLEGGNRLQMTYYVPERASIYDRNGSPLAGVTEAAALGLRSGQLNPDQENALLDAVRQATGIHPNTLRPIIEASRGSDWYIPVADLSQSALNRHYNSLTRYSGVAITPYEDRYYYYGSWAAHIVGYASLIQSEEAEQLRRLGYNIYASRVGRAGLEQWGESILGGKRGGILRLFGPTGDPISTLAQSDSFPAQDIYTTLDINLQVQVQRALGDLPGAIVVLERDTGRVLAMASSPSYNPNLFSPNNTNRRTDTVNAIFNPATTPLLNRAAEAQYPLGSVFKIITMAAALDSGLYQPDTEYNCGYFFEEIQGWRPNDWTYDRFLKDEKTPPSGLLNLEEGLMRSCNPWFWHIGRNLYVSGMPTKISEIARAFGLGSLTGIEISEEPGNMPDPIELMDGTNIAIGQGNVMVTPLQVAAFVAAVGNGGTLYEPRLVESISPPGGESTYTFSPAVKNQLPLSQEHIESLQRGMVSVVSNSRGTANHILGAFSRNNRVGIAGKTGTAETGLGPPHSWFAGYTYNNRHNKPEIAVAVLVESIGEGSEYAAPIFKRVMEIYFNGSPRTIYPWEVEIGVRRTPTPEPTATPIPLPTETPTPEQTQEQIPEPAPTETPVPEPVAEETPQP